MTEYNFFIYEAKMFIGFAISYTVVVCFIML